VVLTKVLRGFPKLGHLIAWDKPADASCHKLSDTEPRLLTFASLKHFPYFRKKIENKERFVERGAARIQLVNYLDACKQTAPCCFDEVVVSPQSGVWVLRKTLLYRVGESGKTL
jgi:hypothetical protein